MMLLTVTRGCSHVQLVQELVTSTFSKLLLRQTTAVSTRLVRGYNSISFGKQRDFNSTTCHRLILPHRFGSGKAVVSEQELTAVQFDKISDDTLDSLTEYFDELVEKAAHLPDADVSYGDGVLTVKFGNSHGTYVINRQTPNKQIWLSSPKSGPKRYDFMNGRWIYKHDGKSMHELLNSEIPEIVKRQVDFCKCSYSKED